MKENSREIKSKPYGTTVSRCSYALSKYFCDNLSPASIRAGYSNVDFLFVFALIQKLLRLTCELTRSFTTIILEEQILYFDNFVPITPLIHWSIRPQNLRLTFSQTLMLQTVLVYRFKRLDSVHGLSTKSRIDKTGESW